MDHCVSTVKKMLNFISLSYPIVYATIIRPSITCNTASIALLLSFYDMYYVRIVVLHISTTVVIFNFVLAAI